MFLNDDHVESTFVKEGLGLEGKSESVLVVKVNERPDTLKRYRPRDYECLSEKLSYLDSLAKEGFLDFNRIEVVASDMHH